MDKNYKRKIYYKCKIDKKWKPYFVWQDKTKIRFAWDPNFIETWFIELFWIDKWKEHLNAFLKVCELLSKTSVTIKTDNWNIKWPIAVLTRYDY